MISITIATYNRSHLLDKILYSLSNQTVESFLYEIIICDSHSIDETNNVIAKFKKTTKLNITHVHTNNILAAKRNIGIKTSLFDFVVFLDDDCIPDENFVSEYIKIASSSDLSNCVYCGIVNYPNKWIKESNYYRFRDENHYVSNNSLILDFKSIVVMNMGFSKSVFLNKIGFVNELFIGYGCEDQELGFRIIQNGLMIKTCKAKIIHYENTSSISGYYSKMYRVGRDGMATLINVLPEAAWSIQSTKILEASFPHKNALNKYYYQLIRFFIGNQLFCKILIIFLERTDNIKFFYFRKLYRLVMASAYINGAKNRNNKLNFNKVQDGWYD